MITLDQLPPNRPLHFAEIARAARWSVKQTRRRLLRLRRWCHQCRGVGTKGGPRPTVRNEGLCEHCGDMTSPPGPITRDGPHYAVTSIAALREAWPAFAAKPALPVKTAAELHAENEQLRKDLRSAQGRLRDLERAAVKTDELILLFREKSREWFQREGESGTHRIAPMFERTPVPEETVEADDEREAS